MYNKLAAQQGGLPYNSSSNERAKHKPVRSNASPLIQKWESIPTWKTKDEDERKAVDWDTSGVLTPTAPLLPSISRTGKDTTTSRLLATWRSLSPTLQVRPPSKRDTTRPWHSPLLHSEMEPSSWPSFANSLWRKRLRQAYAGLLLSLARDQFIQPHRQASQEGTTSFRLWTKGNCEAQTSWHCLEAEVNTCAKIWLELPPWMDTALSRMSWTLITNLHISDTGVTPPSKSGREEIGSTRASLTWEMSYSMSRVAWAAAPMPVWNSDWLWSAFLLAGVKVISSGGVEDQNPKAAGWLEK